MKLLKNKKTKIILGTLVSFFVGFYVYKDLFAKKQEASTVQQTITATVERGNIKETVSASGTIEMANYLAITTGVNGIVKEVFVKEGDIVTKGQKVMEITLNSDGEESLASAWSSYLSAKSALESAKTSLISSESSLINAKEDFQTEKENNSYQTHDERISYSLAENAYKVAQDNYDSQKEEIYQRQIALNKAWLTYQAQSPIIVAPDSGAIANIVVVEGMEISNSLSERTSATIASIKKEGTPIASLNISEVDINKIKVGQKVEITLNSIDNKVFTGTVVGIDKIGTVSSGISNYPVIVKFDESSDSILPNMGIDANIIIQEKENVVYVPTAAIISRRGNTMIRVEGNPEPVRVETGIVTTESAEIVSGVDEGTTVLMDTFPTSGFTSSSQSQGGTTMMFPGTGSGMRRD